MIKKAKFTLIELIVVMGIFSMMLVAVMQIFAGTQNLWTNSENQVSAYADSRAAMDLITRLISNSTSLYQEDANPLNNFCPIYSENGSSLRLKTTEDGHALYVNSSTQAKSVTNVYWVEIKRQTLDDTANMNNERYFVDDMTISALGDDPSNAIPTGLWESQNLTVFSGPEIFSSGWLTVNSIISRVLKLEFKFIAVDNTNVVKSWPPSGKNDLPMAVIVEFTTMDKYNYDRLIGRGIKPADNIEKGTPHYERVEPYAKHFSRTIYLEYKR